MTMAAPPRTPSTVDDFVGRRIRERRTALGLSSVQLVKMIGMTSPQVHKYEAGVNRVPASLLYEIAQALDTPIGYFLKDATPGRSSIRCARVSA